MTGGLCHGQKTVIASQHPSRTAKASKEETEDEVLTSFDPYPDARLWLPVIWLFGRPFRKRYIRSWSIKGASHFCDPISVR